MKDIMSNWVEDHKEVTDSNGWRPTDDYGGVYFPVFDTEEELDTFLWNYIMPSPQALIPCYSWSGVSEMQQQTILNRREE